MSDLQAAALSEELTVKDPLGNYCTPVTRPHFRMSEESFCHVRRERAEHGWHVGDPPRMHTCDAPRLPSGLSFVQDGYFEFHHTCVTHQMAEDRGMERSQRRAMAFQSWPRTPQGSSRAVTERPDSSTPGVRVVISWLFLEHVTLLNLYVVPKMTGKNYGTSQYSRRLTGGSATRVRTQPPLFGLVGARRAARQQKTRRVCKCPPAY